MKVIGLYVLLIFSSLPLIFGWIPPNRWYGFRLPGLIESPELWYRINAIGGRNFLAAMVVCAIANLLLWWKGTEPMQRYLVWINAALILLSVWIVTLELVDHLP